MDLTTLTRVKALAGIETSDTSNDTLLGQLIDAYSQEFEVFMARHMEAKSRTEVYRIRQNNRHVSLKGSPVWDTPALVRYGDTRVMTTSVTLTKDTDYDLDLNTAALTFRFSPTMSPGYLEVTYEGGMETDSAGFIAAYPAISEACDLQVVYHYRRRDFPAGSRTIDAGMGGSIFTAPLDLLEGVKRVLNTYRRRYA